MAYAATPPEQRFWAKVDKGGPNGCWPWIAARTDTGYGVFMLRKGVYVRAHRFAYELLEGPIPEGLPLDHVCRNRACVNPAHLEVVTQRENTLRGTSLVADNARKTHCKRGHPLEGANLIVTARGARECRTCQNEGWRRRYHERAGAV